MNYYLAMWCIEGFECVIDITDQQPDIMGKKNLINTLKGDKMEVDRVNSLINKMKLRARFNTDREYEIYGFMSTIDLDNLKEVSLNTPQVLVDGIRETGYCLFDGRNKVKQLIN